ncbi:MAG: ApbE family lipoprotein [Novosphingobium sp.]|nr:ApbE family lipoprotein [Novosphingobium sp.]
MVASAGELDRVEIGADHDVLLLPPQVDAAARCPVGVELTFGGSVFGTTWMVRLIAESPAAQDLGDGLKRRCEDELAWIDGQMSPWIGGSRLNLYNALPPGAAMVLPEPMRAIVGHAIELQALTGGAFDPFLGAVTDLWGFGPVAVPEGLADPGECTRLRRLLDGPRPDWDGVRLERRAGFALDLCGIAKGHAVDALHDLVRATPGVAAVLVEIGGEAAGSGIKPDAMPWWLELEWPGTFDQRRIVAALHGWACASSGSDVRSFQHEGRRYSHSMDPLTAQPSASDLRGASVFDRHCWRADALATALVVMGRDRAYEFAVRHGIPCLLIPAESDARLVLSPALAQWASDA